MPQLAVNIWADGPISTPQQPYKPDIRAWGTWVEGIITAFISGGGLIYTTKANLDGDLTPGNHAMAWVIGDATTANNGVYQKSGGTGTGSWIRSADLPYSYIVAEDIGAGTANAIQATSSIPISDSALVVVNVFETSTASPLTIQFNGMPILTVKTNTNNDVAPGGAFGGMLLFGSRRGSTFRLINDQVSSAIVAAAEAQANAAAASAALAAGYAAGVHLPGIFAGDKGKVLVAKTDESGFELISPNERVAKTAAYTVVDADYFRTIALGGSTFYELTFGAVAGYRSNFFVRVVNEDTGRGKRIKLGAASPFILWPGQSNIFYVSGGAWQPFIANQRWRPPINVTLYFDEALGSDSNDGLAPGAGNALYSPQYGIGIYHDQMDLIAGAPQVTFQFADNADASGALLAGLVGYEGMHYAGPATGAEGRSTLVLAGNASNPLQTKILGNNAGLAGLQVFGNSRLRVQNLYVCGGANGPGLSVSDGSQARLNNVIFGDSLTCLIFAELNSQVVLENQIKWKGSPSGANGSLVRVQHGSRFVSQGMAIHLAGNVSTALAHYVADAQSAIDVYGSSFVPNGFTATGKRYQITKMSYLDTGTGTPNSVVTGTANGTTDATSFAN